MPDEKYLRFHDIVHGSPGASGMSFADPLDTLENAIDSRDGNQKYTFIAMPGVETAKTTRYIYRNGDRFYSHKPGPQESGNLRGGYALKVPASFNVNHHLFESDLDSVFPYEWMHRCVFSGYWIDGQNNLGNGKAAIRMWLQGEVGGIFDCWIYNSPIGIEMAGPVGTRAAPGMVFNCKINQPDDSMSDAAAYKLGPVNGGCVILPKADGNKLQPFVPFVWMTTSDPVAGQSGFSQSGSDFSSWTVLAPALEKGWEPDFRVDCGSQASGNSLTPQLNVLGGMSQSGGSVEGHNDVVKIQQGGGTPEQIPNINMLGYLAQSKSNWINDTVTPYTQPMGSGRSTDTSGLLQYKSWLRILQPMDIILDIATSTNKTGQDEYVPLTINGNQRYLRTYA